MAFLELVLASAVGFLIGYGLLCVAVLILCRIHKGCR